MNPNPAGAAHFLWVPRSELHESRVDIQNGGHA